MARRTDFENASGPCTCPGPRTRREFLKVGVISGIGLGLGDYLHLRDAQAAGNSRLREQVSRQRAFRSGRAECQSGGGLSTLSKVAPRTVCADSAGRYGAPCRARSQNPHVRCRA